MVGVASTHQIRSIPPNELHRLRQERDVVLVDVREPDEHEAWRIEGSVNVPLSALSAGASVPTHAPVVLYCARGPRSETAQRILARRGLEAPYLEGGLVAWNGVYEHVALRTSGGAEVVQIQRVGKGCLSYLVVKDGEAVAIDPTVDVEEYAQAARERDARIVAVLDTHAHADHASGARALAEATGATYRAPAEVGPHVPHEPLVHGARVAIGGGFLETVATPGHTPGSLTFLIDDVAFTGDSLFVDSVGRPDLGQDPLHMGPILRRTLHERLLALPPDTRVLPGHRGDASPAASGLVSARVGDLPARIPALAYDEAAFTAWVVRNATPKPENFETIKKINLGVVSARDLAEIRELEAGPNRCAVSG